MNKSFYGSALIHGICMLLAILAVVLLAKMFLADNKPQCPIEEPVVSFEHCNYIDRQ